MLAKIAPYQKAVLGFLAPGAVVIGSAVTEASDGGTAITAAEWVTAVVAMIVTGAAVYTVPNQTPERIDVQARLSGYTGKRRDEDGDGKPDGIPGATLPDGVTERGTP